MTNDELLHKWVENTISDSELQLFKARPEYDSLVKLYENTENLATPAIDTEEILQSILSSDSESKQVPVSNKTTKFRLWPSIALAASVVLIAAYFLFNNATTTFENSTNQQLAKSLPGGSKVTLYANSKIDFDESNWSNARSINLKGKAFFDVETGSTFTVNCTKGLVQVLGTQFLVDNKKESFEVNCSEGKVKVSSNSSAANAILIENESVEIFDQGGSILRQQKLTKVKNISLEKVIEELETIFTTKVNNTNVDLNQRITTGFENDNLENAIKTISEALMLDYEKQGKTFIIKNR